jgi:hypothetical protein
MKRQLLTPAAQQWIEPWSFLSLIFRDLLLIFAKTYNEKYSVAEFHLYAVQLTS